MQHERPHEAAGARDSAAAARPGERVKTGCAMSGHITINLTSRVQQLCETYGLWRKGRPKGALAAVLPAKAAWACPRTDALLYECDRSQVDALLQVAQTLQRDLGNARCSQRDGAAVAQWVRRIRETIAGAAQRQPAHRTLQPTARSVAATSAQPVRVPPCQRRQRRPLQAGAGSLFSPPPTGAKAVEAYRQHTMRCVRELVDFSQSSAYGEASCPNP